MLTVAVAALASIGFIVGSGSSTSAYHSYSTSGYYLSEIDGDNEAYSYHTVQYGDWYCWASVCNIPITATLQYYNVWYTSEAFTCWYQEVFTLYVTNQRSGNQSINYWTTPYYNWQYSWGSAYSVQGNQLQHVAIGDESTECYAYGAGGGLYFRSAIVRNSTSAYTESYGW